MGIRGEGRKGRPWVPPPPRRDPTACEIGRSGASPEERDHVDDVRGELEWMKEEIQGSLDRLSRDGGPPERSQIVGPFARGVTALEEILELVAGGRGADTDEASMRAAHEIAVSDVFDAMVSDRAYRGGRSVEDALAELRRCAGSQFDPAVVEAFAAVVAEREPVA